MVWSFKGLGNGHRYIIMTDGLFCCYRERDYVALVNATPSSFDILGKFSVPLGTGPHWAHPVFTEKDYTFVMAMLSWVTISKINSVLFCS